MISSNYNLVLSNGSYWYWHICTLHTIFTLHNSFFKGGSGRKKYNGTKRNSTPSHYTVMCAELPVPNHHICIKPCGSAYPKNQLWKNPKTHLGQEHWLHTFQIPLPRKLYLPQLYCNMPLCKTAGHIIKSFNLLRMQCMASVNSTVYHIHDLVPTTEISQERKFIGRSRSKRGLSDFVGKISKSLFGIATSGI